MIIIFSILCFSLLFMLKGGWLGRLSFWTAFESRVNSDFYEVIRDISQHWTVLRDNWSALEKWADRWIAIKAFIGNDSVQAAFIYAPFISFLHWMIDGSNLSALILFGISFFVLPDVQTAAWFALAWWVWIITSMGEEAGAVGDYEGGWGPYIQHSEDFGRYYGVKKSVLLGLAGGGLMAAATDWWWFMLAGATFPIVYFIASSIYRLIHKSKSWAYAEPLYGVPFGIAAGLFLGGV